MRLSRRVPFHVSLVHSVIADVASYPSFIPEIRAARIIPQSPNIFDADLDVDILGKMHTYRSRVCVESNVVRAEASTFMGKLEIGWYIKESGDATRVDFHLTTSIPGFSWLLPREWPLRVINAFTKRCEDLA